MMKPADLEDMKVHFDCGHRQGYENGCTLSIADHNRIDRLIEHCLRQRRQIRAAIAVFECGNKSATEMYLCLRE